MSYTIEYLAKNGPEYAMALLLHCINHKKSFVTYGEIRTELEHQFNIDKIFSTHPGVVAGTLMNNILEIDPDAPLINAIITNPDGIPGKGIGSYFANRYADSRYLKWKSIEKSEKEQLVLNERKKIFLYDKWDYINQKLFGKQNPEKKIQSHLSNEHDGKSYNFGGTGESQQHKNLKHWVASNPQALGISEKFGLGREETSLRSGDVVDVLFSDGVNYITVEVKSCLSNDQDFERGIYQCVKYREVKKAECAPLSVKTRSILVTERALPPYLKERAKLLGINIFIASVNTEE